MMVWHGHAWWHTFAMWNTNLSHPDAFIAHMSVLSIFYNYMGGDGGARRLTSLLQPEKPITVDSLAFQAPMLSLVHAAELVPYSRFVAFIVRTYAIHNQLLTEPEFSSAFPSIDHDAMFVDTVLHSLDHWMLHELFDQPCTRALWEVQPTKQIGDVKWDLLGKATSFAYTVSDDHPRIENIYIRQSPHPFHQRFYKEVSSVDPELAWHMQACMAK